MSDSAEKVAIVSNFTSVLDQVAALAQFQRWAYYRLDGSTPLQRRQPLVDAFNRGLAIASSTSSNKTKNNKSSNKTITTTSSMFYDDSDDEKENEECKPPFLFLLSSKAGG